MRVLLYGYATGVFPSHGIARRLEEDVAFRVSGAGNLPDHRTLRGFRRRHPEDFRGLFPEEVRVARRMGLVRFGKLSANGTKARAVGGRGRTRRPNRGGPRLRAVRCEGLGQGTGGMGPGASGAGHRAVAIAPGSVRPPPAGWCRNHPYRRARRIFRTLPRPCRSLRISGVPILVSAPHRVRPVHPLTFLSCPSTARAPGLPGTATVPSLMGCVN